MAMARWVLPVPVPPTSTALHDFRGFGIKTLLNAVAPRNGTVSNETANALLAVVDGARPKDEIEAMLASQMAPEGIMASGHVNRI